MFDSAAPRSLPKHLAWRTIPIPKYPPLAGWIAGPAVGVWTHHGGKVSKPCWRRMTGGELKCPQCATSKLRWIAYQPLVTNKGADKRVVIVSRTVFPEVEKLPCWTPVVCVTPNQRGMPSSIRPSNDVRATDETTKRLSKLPPADIREYLLRVLWAVPELCEHFGTTCWNAE